MTRDKSSKQVGDALEKHVSAYYEALGFQIVRDVNISGHQIDIYAKRYVPGLRHLSVAVEVKYRSGIVGVNDVTSFINAAVQLMASGAINSAAIVTNSRFSADARTAAGDRIQLLTLKDLEQDLFNNSESLIRITKEYEEYSIFSEYYPLGLISEDLVVADAVSYLFDWSARGTGFITILGDFGSGKSTILNRVLYESAKSRIKHYDRRYPVYLPLRLLNKYDDIWDFIVECLRERQYISPPKHVFNDQLDAGNLIILLDGLDEINPGGTSDERSQYLLKLAPLLDSPSPCVLSSRPTFFESLTQISELPQIMLQRRRELKRLPANGIDRAKLARIFNSPEHSPLKRSGRLSNSLTFHVEELNDSQVKEIVNQHKVEIKNKLNLEPEVFLEQLYKIYDLHDLMSRPLLLNMIMQTVISGAIDITSDRPVGPSTLYDIYTQEAAEREFAKINMRNFLSADERLETCRLMAIHMLDKGEIVLNVSDIKNCLKAALSRRYEGSRRELDEDDLARAVRDIKVFTFLKFSDDGSLNFVHRSFYEFFVSQEIFVTISSGDTGYARRIAANVSREIVYFLGSYIRDHPGFAETIKNRVRSAGDSDCRDLLNRVIFASGVALGFSFFQDVGIKSVSVATASIPALTMARCRLDKVLMRNIIASKWHMSKIALHDTEIVSSIFTDSLLDIVSDDLSFSGVEFRSSSVTLSGKNLGLNGCSFEKVQLLIDSRVSAGSGLIVSEGRVNINELACLRLLGEAHFRSVILASRQMEGWYELGTGLKMTDCLLGGLWISGYDLFAPDTLLPSIELIDCRGLILTWFPADTRNGQIHKKLAILNPKLKIVEISDLQKAVGETIHPPGGGLSAASKETRNLLRTVVRECALDVASLCTDVAILVKEIEPEIGSQPPPVRASSQRKLETKPHSS